MSGSRWSERDDVPRGDDYDSRWAALEEAGESIHGEADLVTWLLEKRLLEDPRRSRRHSVLDAGCGTGRVAIELAARGNDVVGVDLDPGMLDAARAKAPELQWVLGDLATTDLGRTFDLVVMAGNVMIFVAPGSEATVLANLARHTGPDGLVVAGFQLGADRLDLAAYDEHCAAAGLVLDARWSTWDREPFTGGEYAVSVHRRS